MTLQQLKYALAIADGSSICEAAKLLFIAQPTLSNAIKDLENELGIHIFLRSNKGILVSNEGKQFLGYARQVIEQAQVLEEEYLGDKTRRQHFCISTQHYAFAVHAFVNLIKEFGMDHYDFSLRETKTFDIIDDVKNMRSEIGILYVNEFNEKVIQKLLHESNLLFKPLFIAKPHVFVSASNPLSHKKIVCLKDLENYPYLSFEQGDNNSFYYSEEILSTLEHNKNINVSDRATLYNLLIGLNGFTISSGIPSEELNEKNIVAIPLNVVDSMQIGTITHRNVILSKLAESYLSAIEATIPQ